MLTSFTKFYKNLFKDQLFIIKASGKVIIDREARENLIENIKELTEDGIKILFIYGGGASIDKAMDEANITPLKIEGRRISSEKDIKIIKKVLAGDIGFKISESLVKCHLPSNVLNALPPHWAKAKRRSNHKNILRFDGTLIDINTESIRDHFSATNLVVCPCLAFTPDGTALNINADNVAIELATEVKANKLILMTDIDGVIVDNKVQSVLTGIEIEKLISDGTVTDGMKVKLENCVNAIRSGVKRVHILNGLKPDALRDEVYTSTGTGTMIVRTPEKEIYEQEELQN